LISNSLSVLNFCRLLSLLRNPDTYRQVCT
jgi:hypothetical protein